MQSSTAMVLKPPLRAALGDLIANILRNAILEGSFKPGDALHENTLARQLSVSRSPIREALMQLERERLVVSRINRPAVVRRPSPEEIRQVYTIRAALEGIAARWAAEKATTAFVSHLAQKAEDLNKATIAAGHEADFKSCRARLRFPCGHCGSGRLARTAISAVEPSQPNQARYGGRTCEPDEPARGKIHSEHVALITAIAESDGDRASYLATVHVLGARDRLVHLDVDAKNPKSFTDR